MYSTKLSLTDSVAGGDYLSLFKQSSGDWRGLPASVLLAYMQENLALQSTSFTKQYAAPALTAFTVEITGTGINIWLILRPSGTLAAGTIQLPAPAGAVDKQEVLVNCTQAVTALTVDGNGSTVIGAPTALAANDSFRMKYDPASEAWYKVG